MLERAIRSLIGLSAVFALICIGIFFITLTARVKNLSNEVTKTLTDIRTDVNNIQTMSGATLYQIGDVSHEAADMIRYQKKYLDQESSSLVATTELLNATMQKVESTVTNLNLYGSLVTESTVKALDTVPGVTIQLQSTLAETQKTVAKTGSTIEELNQLMAQIQPTIKHVNESTEHLNNMSASLDQVIQDAVKPKPWYKKLPGYIWAPIKIVAIFAK